MRGIVRAAHVAPREAARARLVALRVPLHGHRLRLPGALALDLSRHPPAARRRRASRCCRRWSSRCCARGAASSRFRSTTATRDLEQPDVRSAYQTPAVFGRVLGLIVRKRLADFGARPRAAAAGRSPASSFTPGSAALRAAREGVAGPVGHADARRAARPRRARRRVRPPVRAPRSPCCDDAPPGPLVEVGCGKGHLLGELREIAPGAPRAARRLDVSRAVSRASRRRPRRRAWRTASSLPLRSGSRRGAAVYAGSLHHLIDYPLPRCARRCACSSRGAARGARAAVVVVQPPDAPAPRPDRLPLLRRSTSRPSTSATRALSARTSSCASCARNRCRSPTSSTPISWPIPLPAATRAPCSRGATRSWSACSRLEERGSRTMPWPRPHRARAGVAIHRRRREGA